MTNPIEQRQDRIKYLRKVEDRKRKLPELLSSLTLIAGQKITEHDVLSIEETVEVWSKIHKNENLQKANLSISLPYREKDKLTNVFKSLERSLSGQKQYFTTAKFYDTCLLLIETSFCIPNYEKLIEFDGDTFFIYDKNINNSIRLDAHEEHWRDKDEYLWTYELRVNGVEWIDIVYKAFKEIEKAFSAKSPFPQNPS